MMKKNQARLLYEAGEALLKIREYLTPKGSSEAFRRDRFYELKSALTDYPKEKIQTYLNILEKYDLKKEAKRLEEDYSSLEKLAENSEKHIPISLQPCSGFKR